MVKRDYRTWFFSGCPKNSRMVFLLREVCYPNQRDLKLQILSWSWLFLCKWVVSPKSNSINESSIYFYATWNRPYVVELRRRRWHPTPVLLPGKSHGWRSLVSCTIKTMHLTCIVSLIYHYSIIQNNFPALKNPLCFIYLNYTCKSGQQWSLLPG